jgi:hypothetical protein
MLIMAVDRRAAFTALRRVIVKVADSLMVAVASHTAEAASRMVAAVRHTAAVAATIITRDRWS